MFSTRSGIWYLGVAMLFSFIAGLAWRAVRIDGPLAIETELRLPHSGTTFILKLGDACIGSVTFRDINESQGASYSAQGALRIVLSQKMLTLPLEIQFDFNSIRQLGVGYLRIAGPRELTIAVQNVDPIQLSVREGKTRLYTTEVRGPIFYRQVGKERYLNINELKTRMPQSLFHSPTALFQGFSIQRGEADQGAEEGTERRCLSDEALPLDPYMNFLEGVSKNLGVPSIP